jgi:hypothetical protein
MSDQLRPQQGARPWLPAYDVTSRLLLNEYNIPLAGLIDQDDVTYLYVCLMGELEDVNIWAYALVEDAEIGLLTSLTGDDLAAAINGALTRRTLVVAIAADHELVDWIPVRVDAAEPLEIARSFVKQMRRRWDTIRMEVEDLERQPELAS